MNNRGSEFNIQGMMIGILVVGLFFGMIGSIMQMLSADYDISDYNESDLNKYNMMQNLSEDVNDAYSQVDQVTVDKSVFDYLGDIWSKVITPFKFVYRSFSLLITMGSYLVSDLGLLSVFGDFIITLVSILVIVGLVLIKYYMNRSK